MSRWQLCEQVTLKLWPLVVGGGPKHRLLRCKNLVAFVGIAEVAGTHLKRRRRPKADIESALLSSCTMPVLAPSGALVSADTMRRSEPEARQ